MEFTNEIFFNKKLIQGESVLITYSGKLYKEYSSEITIVYGFGDNWDYTQETKMQEKENGFEALITLKDYNTFNFCFKNNYNIWDNNSGFNYIATIEVAPEVEEIQTQEIVEEQSTQPVEEIPQTTEKETATEQIPPEVEPETDIEKAFSDLLDSILQFSQNEVDENVNLENGFGLQSVDEVEEISEVSEENFTSCDDLFQEMYDELSKITSEEPQETKVENIETVSASQEIEQDTESPEISTDLESLLNDFSERQEQKTKTVTAAELDEIMENILNSIVEDTPNETVQQTPTTENTLPAVQAEKRDFLDVCIDSTVSFFGYAWKACKKLGVLLKETVKELFTENE